MNTLAAIVDSAVATAIAEHPKLFDAKALDRVRRVLTREIMRSLTRGPNADGEGSAKPELHGEPKSYERVAAGDERCVAYCNLRIAARELAPPIRLSGGDIYLAPEASGPHILPFAKMPTRDRWLFVTEIAPMTAWREYFDAALPNLARRPFVEKHGGMTGIWVPWLWPPSKTGKVYEPESEAVTQ